MEKQRSNSADAGGTAPAGERGSPTRAQIEALNAEIARAKGCRVSQWSIHPLGDVDMNMTQAPGCNIRRLPVRKEQYLGTAQYHYSDDLVLLPDDKGDSPMFQMLVDGEWKAVTNWAENWDAAMALEGEVPEEWRPIYLMHLQREVERDMVESLLNLNVFALVHARPYQRARAWLAWWKCNKAYQEQKAREEESRGRAD